MRPFPDLQLSRAEGAARRAEARCTRLLKVERDQAEFFRLVYSDSSGSSSPSSL